ncbi:MAG: lactonase family protein [Coprobacillaceae bacterium]
MEKSLFFVGNYNLSTDSEGIYGVTLDEMTGELEIVSTCDECENPSYLAIRNHILCVANELGDTAYLTAYTIHSDGSMTLLDKIVVPGAGACYIALWKDGTHISGANYTTGNVFTCSLDSNGKFKQVMANYQNEGKGKDEIRQDAPHMHSITSDINGEYWLAADLGTDDIFYYKSNRDNGQFKLIEKLKIDAGEGPRHFVFDDTNTYGYLVTELASNIYVYKLQNDKLLLIQKCNASLKDGIEESNYASHITLSKNKKYVYVSNRGANTIDIFKIQSDGTLRPYTHVDSHGHYPRHFEVSPSGNYMIIAHQKSHEVVCCKVDDDGIVGEYVSKVSIPKAINICFVK